MIQIVRLSARYIHVKSLQINFIDHKKRCGMENNLLFMPSIHKLYMLLLIMFINFFFVIQISHHGI